MYNKTNKVNITCIYQSEFIYFPEWISDQRNNLANIKPKNQNITKKDWNNKCIVVIKKENHQRFYCSFCLISKTSVILFISFSFSKFYSILLYFFLTTNYYSLNLLVSLCVVCISLSVLWLLFYFSFIIIIFFVCYLINFQIFLLAKFFYLFWKHIVCSIQWNRVWLRDQMWFAALELTLLRWKQYLEVVFVFQSIAHVTSFAPVSQSSQQIDPYRFLFTIRFRFSIVICSTKSIYLSIFCSICCH